MTSSVKDVSLKFFLNNTGHALVKSFDKVELFLSIPELFLSQTVGYGLIGSCPSEGQNKVNFTLQTVLSLNPSLPQMAKRFSLYVLHEELSIVISSKCLSRKE